MLPENLHDVSRNPPSRQSNRIAVKPIEALGTLTQTRRR
jgi:hypothetical protein